MATADKLPSSLRSGFSTSPCHHSNVELENMKCVITTIVISVFHAVNLAFHGGTAWGAQAGGSLTVFLYYAQLLVALLAIVSAVIWLIKASPSWRLVTLVITGILAAAIIYSYVKRGWMIATTIHYQGMENIFAVIPATVAGLYCGYVAVKCQREYLLNKSAHPTATRRAVDGSS